MKVHNKVDVSGYYYKNEIYIRNHPKYSRVASGTITLRTEAGDFIPITVNATEYLPSGKLNPLFFNLELLYFKPTTVSSAILPVLVVFGRLICKEWKMGEKTYNSLAIEMVDFKYERYFFGEEKNYFSVNFSGLEVINNQEIAGFVEHYKPFKSHFNLLNKITIENFNQLIEPDSIKLEGYFKFNIEKVGNKDLLTGEPTYIKKRGIFPIVQHIFSA